MLRRRNCLLCPVTGNDRVSETWSCKVDWCFKLLSASTADADWWQFCETCQSTGVHCAMHVWYLRSVAVLRYSLVHTNLYLCAILALLFFELNEFLTIDLPSLVRFHLKMFFQSLLGSRASPNTQMYFKFNYSVLLIVRDEENIKQHLVHRTALLRRKLDKQQ